MIHVIAMIQLKPGAQDEFLSCFREVIPSVRAEQGCLAYEPTVDAATNLAAQPDPRQDVVTVVEKWESLEALEAHLVAPHMLSYRQRVKSLVEGVSLHVLTSI